MLLLTHRCYILFLSLSLCIGYYSMTASAIPAYPVPPNELKRLEQLKKYQVMGTAREPAFDRITALVKQFFDVPVVAITFLDENSQFFKSIVGYDAYEMPRAMAICNHTIVTKEAFVVPDTHLHPVLKDHVLTVNSPYMRFYAGVPLQVTDATGETFALGALCLIDTEPHEALTQAQIAILQQFASVVVDTLELRLQKSMAQKSNELRSAFIANMSHEIRTPMNGIMGTLELLKQTSLDNQQQTYLTHITASSESLLAVVNDMLDLSKIEAGQIQLEKVAVDFYGLCESVIQDCMPLATDKAVNLQLAYPNLALRYIKTDPNRLKQVLTTLVRNAINFTPAQGYVALQVGEGNNANSLLIQVIDTGRGIKPDSQAVIFDAFNQADKYTHRLYGGVGLSLSVCRLLVEKMGGSLSVSDRAILFAHEVSELSERVPPTGTVFSIHLNVEAMAYVETAENYFLANITQQKWLKERLSAHVLLVEDDNVSGMIAKKTLQKYGYTSTWVKDGQQAIDTYLATPDAFQIILMDHQMPILDGVSAVKRLKARVANLPPIIAVTAHATHGDKTLYLQAGMQDYCAKPYKGEYLDYLMQYWLHQYQKA